ncbi:MAG: hypothetical protein ABW133_21865 [Polyangiaceae bacterium]
MLWSLDFRRFTLVLAGAMLVGAGCKTEESKQSALNPTEKIFSDFSKRVDDYMALRKSIVDSVGQLDPTKSQIEISDRSTSLANGVIAARAQAKQGDVFAPEFAALVATLIKEEYKRRSISVQDTRSDQQDELPDFKPTVNQVYPTTYPLATFPATLLPLLPPLPEQLEYRIVQHYLVLRDIEANVILDFMPNAVPL